MATKRAPKITYTTPKGVFRYPNLIKPDFGTDEHPHEGGQFNVQLILSPEATKELQKKLAPEWKKAQEMADQEFAKLTPQQRKKLNKTQFQMADYFSEFYANKTDEEPTGDFVFKFKTKATGTSPKDGSTYTRTIPLFDSFGRPAKLSAIWGGTVGKISFNVNPYFVPSTCTGGLSLYLSAAQIIELVSGGQGADGSSFGFGEEEGGFEAGDVDEGGDTAGTSSDATSDVDEDATADF